MIKIALTYDYELFFNDTYESDKEVLIDSTDSIMKALVNSNVRGTFFVDTCMLERFQKGKNSKCQISPIQLHALNTYDLVIDQIHRLINMGFEIGLHMHSIWNTAEWKNESSLQKGNWIFDDMDYMPSAHPIDAIKNNIDYGIELLNKISDEEHAPHVVSFRAGGFSYEPKEVLFDELYKRGIRVDSSVCKYIFKGADNQRYNYLSVPNHISHWSITKGEINKQSICADYSMIELPITADNNLIFKWNSYKKNKAVRCVPKGKPSNLVYGSAIAKKRDYIKGKFFNGVPLILDSMNYKSMIDLVRIYEKKNYLDDDVYVVALGHPKFQDHTTIENTISFINRAKELFNCRFETLRDMAIELNTRYVQ